ncbi:MAG: hypothetical protein NTX82_05075 [Candidatus Parcubacteria bacterium]|nr:hypothetical protein [Candidatus Parcubacteria bacterium]
MNDRIAELTRTIDDSDTKLKRAREELSRIRSSCLHQWGPVRDCSEYKPAYDIPGDPPGTMGVDWRPGCHVPAQTIEKWQRTCRLCGLTETTTETNQQVTHTPRFR